LFADTSLLQDGICRMPRLDFTVNDESAVGERTEPDFVIAFTLAFEPAAMGREEFLDLRCKR
jgi:hypothetical protein